MENNEKENNKTDVSGHFMIYFDHFRLLQEQDENYNLFS